MRSCRGGNRCKWVPREKSIRDNPSIGIIECQKSHLIKSAIDLSKSINYEKGTIYDLALGYGDTLDPVQQKTQAEGGQQSKMEKSYGF